MEQKMQETRNSGLKASTKRTPEEQAEFDKIKGRIKKDHLKEDFDINFGDKVESDYKKNFKED